MDIDNNDIQLPSEIWSKIFDYLNIRDLKNVSSVDTYFHHITQPLLWYSLKVKITPNSLVWLYDNSRKPIKKLTLKFSLKSEEVKGNDFPPVFENLVELQELRLKRQFKCEQFMSDELFVTLGKLSNLQVIDLAFSENVTASRMRSISHLSIKSLNMYYAGVNDDILTEIAKMKSLTTLNLDVNGFSGDSFARLNNLPLLNLSIYWDYLDYVFEHHFNLEVLDLTSVCYDTDEYLRKLTLLKNLKSLSLSSTCNISKVGAAALATLPVKKLYFIAVNTNNEQNKYSDYIIKEISTLVGLTELHYICGKLTGDTMNSLANLSGLQKLFLRGSKTINSCRMEYIKHLRLTVLEVNGTDINDGCMQSVSCLTNLKVLNISDNCLTDEGLHHLKTLVNLEELDMVHLGCITSNGLSFLQHATKLKSLDLSYCSGICSTGLSYLSSSTGMRKLRLHSCSKISSNGLRYIHHFPDLLHLNICSCTGIKSDGFAFLPSSLTSLYMDDMDAEEGCLVHLYKLKNLKGLLMLGGNDKIVHRNFVNDSPERKIISEFEKHLPNIEIFTR